MWERTLSQKLVRLFCEQKVVDESKADAYVYGYELLISSVVSVLLVILVSAVCGDVRYSLSFLIGFIPQRIYIGGYHATSHTRCYLAFTGLALICILLSKVIAANHLFRILTTAALMGIAIFFSPIEATNKPLGKKKRLSYKMVASVLSSIDFLFAIFNVLPDTRSITVYYISKWVLVIFAIIPFFSETSEDILRYEGVHVFSEDECSKKYQTEVTEMKKIMLLLSKVTCIMAMALAVLSVNSTCGFTAYQPDVPESLEHD